MNMKVEISPDLVWPTDINDVPKEVFVRQDIFEKELDVFFYGPYWHPVAHEAEIPNPGDFKTFDLGRVPLLIARDNEGEIRVFLNICSHRGTQVETEACGNKKGFECPYHRWSFSNNGELRNCPSSEDFSPKFSKEAYGLKQVKMEILYGMIMVSLSDDPPEFSSYIGRAAEVLQKQIGHEGGLKMMGYQKVKYAVNWKAYVDNDGYHAPLLHTGFRLLGWQSGGGETFITDNRLHGGAVSQLKPGKNMGILKDPSLIEFKDAEWDAGSFVCGLWPFVILVKHLDVISIRFAIARAPDVTEVHYAYFAKNTDDDAMAMHRVRQASNMLGPCGMISMEDAAIFQRVQVGSYSPGVVTFQKGVNDLRSFENFEYKQNDETVNIGRWEYYRQVMGFKKEGEA